MQRQARFGLGALFVGAVLGCSSDPAPGSSVSQPTTGGGGAGGTGSLALGGAGGAGTGGGGAGGTATGGTATGGTAQAGGSTGGASTQGGTSSSAGSQGTGGSKPGGTCERAMASDGDCADLYDDKPQAYACDDIGAAVALNGMHAQMCASVAGVVAGAAYGECCPP